jgi:hypothetical protein
MSYTHEQRLAYARAWRKAHPHYTRDRMRIVRGTTPERYQADHRRGVHDVAILGVSVNPRVGRKYYGTAKQARS